MSRKILLIGIDPGAKGGYAFRGANETLETGNLPETEGDILEMIRSLAVAAGVNKFEKIAYLEDLVKFTGTPMASSAMATYASSWGFLKGVLSAHGFQIVMTRPQKWQTYLGLARQRRYGRTRSKQKHNSFSRA